MDSGFGALYNLQQHHGSDNKHLQETVCINVYNIFKSTIYVSLM